MKSLEENKIDECIQISSNLNENGLIDLKDSNFSCIFHHICAKNLKYEQFQKLIFSKKIDANVKNYKGETPLHMAFRYCSDSRIIEHLLENGGDMTIKSKKGKDSFHNACKNQNYHLIINLAAKNKFDFMTSNKFGENSYHYSFKYNQNLEFIKYLIENKADVYSKNKFETTPLFYCFGNENLEIVKFLIEKYNINLNMKNKIGNNPIHFNVNSNKNIKVLKYMVEELRFTFIFIFFILF